MHMIQFIFSFNIDNFEMEMEFLKGKKIFQSFEKYQVQVFPKANKNYENQWSKFFLRALKNYIIR